MALNLYKVRVYAGLILGPFITVLSFFVVLNFYGFLWSLIGLFVGVLISVLVGKLMIKNAFSDMLEGKGVLCLNLDSTGIIRPFVVAVHSPYIKNKKMGLDDVFDRSAVMQLATPEKARVPLQGTEEGGVKLVLDKKAMMKVKSIDREVGILELNKSEYKVLKNEKGVITLQLNEKALKELEKRTKENMTVVKLDEDKYNKGRFALFHYPCLLYNDQIKSILTKDFLAEQEKEAFAEHGILYLNRKMEELTSIVRDFGRYVVELTKPQTGLLSKWWVWAIIIVFVGILVAMFAGPVITAIKGTAGSAAGAVSTAAGGSVTPR